MKNNRNLNELERTIGYRFQDVSLLRQAMTHSSYTNESRIEKTDCNERMEFLGDAVLELVSTEYLYGRYPDVPEGDLTKKRASMVCEASLAVSAREMCLGDYLFMGKGEELTGGRDRSSVIADSLEALIGSIYLDGGLASAKEFIMAHVLNDIEHKSLFYDSKTILQEIAQGEKLGEPVYRLVGEEGPDHNKTFEIELRVGERTFGPCKGRSKKAAEQAAAYEAVIALQHKQAGETCI